MRDRGGAARRECGGRSDGFESPIDLGVDPQRVHVAELVSEGLARALAVTPPEGQVVVTGSLYVVGAARSVLVPT